MKSAVRFTALMIGLGLLISSIPAYGAGVVQGYIQRAESVVVFGIQSRYSYLRTFPGAVCNVYQFGTTTNAVIFSDAATTTLMGNPVTADGNGYVRLYTLESQVDLRCSGAGISSPFTITAFTDVDISGFGLTEAQADLRYPQIGTVVPVTRQVNVTAPLTGGGALSGDITISCPTCPGVGGVGYNEVREEGVALTQRQILNFIGAAITAADNGGTGRTDITLNQTPAGSASVVGSGRIFSATAPLRINAGASADLTTDPTLSCPTCVELAGQLGGTTASPDVRGIRSADGTLLPISTLPADTYLYRSAGGFISGASAYNTVQAGGIAVAVRKILNFGSDFTVSDNIGSTRTDITCPSCVLSAAEGAPSADAVYFASQAADPLGGGGGFANIGGFYRNSVTSKVRFWNGTVWDDLLGATTGVQSSRTISTGLGLTGGGDLTANRTIAFDYTQNAFGNVALGQNECVFSKYDIADPTYAGIAVCEGRTVDLFEYEIYFDALTPLTADSGAVLPVIDGDIAEIAALNKEQTWTTEQTFGSGIDMAAASIANADDVSATTVTATSVTAAGSVEATWMVMSQVQGAYAKDLVEAAATGFVRVNIPVSTNVAGHIDYAIFSEDGVDYQSRSGVFYFSAVNKGGTETCVIFRSTGGTTVDDTTDNIAASAGTLTNTFDCSTVGANTFLLRANATSSLAQTTLRINYRIHIDSGQNVTVIPQ